MGLSDSHWLNRLPFPAKLSNMAATLPWVEDSLFLKEYIFIISKNLKII